MNPASETSQEKMLYRGKEREIRKSTKMESFFWEKCGREKWKRRAYLFLREALTPSVGSSIWDGQDNMLVRTVKKSKLFRREIGEDSNWKKSSVLVDTTSLSFTLKEKLPVDVNGKTFHWLHSGWPLWVHFQEETSQRVAICLCQILPPLPTRPPDLTTLLRQHFRKETMTYKSTKSTNLFNLW